MAMASCALGSRAACIWRLSIALTCSSHTPDLNGPWSFSAALLRTPGNPIPVLEIAFAAVAATCQKRRHGFGWGLSLRFHGCPVCMAEAPAFSFLKPRVSLSGGSLPERLSSPRTESSLGGDFVARGTRSPRRCLRAPSMDTDRAPEMLEEFRGCAVPAGSGFGV